MSDQASPGSITDKLKKRKSIKLPDQSSPETSPSMPMRQPSVNRTSPSRSVSIVGPSSLMTNLADRFSRVAQIESVPEMPSSPQLMSPSLDVGKRKSRMISLMPPTHSKATQHPTSPQKQPQPKQKGFREWHAPQFTEALFYLQSIKQARLDTKEFSATIQLEDLFGLTPEIACQSMIWAGRNLEKLRNDAAWLEKQAAPVYVRGKKPYKELEDDESDDGDEDVKYRKLNIFKDAPLDRVLYTPADPLIILSARPLDLIDALIFPLNQHTDTTHLFLLSFRDYIPAKRFLESLIEWYNVDLDDPPILAEELFLKKHRRQIQARVVRILITWVSGYWQDFVGDSRLYCELMRFLVDAASVSFGDAEKLSTAIREQRLQWYTLLYIDPFPPKMSSLSNDIAKPYALHWKAEEFAVQLTLIDQFLFQQVKPNTYIHILAGRMEKRSGAYNLALKPVLEYVAWFRLISSYVASLVYREETTKKKGNAIKIWLKIAKVRPSSLDFADRKECKRLGNYNTLFAIMHGLKRPAIINLAAAWEQLNAKVLEEFSMFETITCNENGFAGFWDSWKAVKVPAIPFFAAYMHDLTSQSTHLRTYTIGSDAAYYPDLSRPVNIPKYQELAHLVAELESFRQHSYPDTLAGVVESAVVYGLPVHGSVGGSDLSGYVLTHIREWSCIGLVEDKELDRIG